MANVFVSYDLDKPGQNYEAVMTEIKTHGAWAKVEYSLFYLSTQETAKSIAEAVWAKMDANDKLIVVDATRGHAYWYGLDSKVAEFMLQNWQK